MAFSAWIVLGSAGTLYFALRPELGVQRLIFLALVVCGGLLLGVGSATRGHAAGDGAARSALWVALGLWAASLSVVLYLKLHAYDASELAWTRYPYRDKRWMLALYWSSVLAVLWLPLVVRWLLARGRTGARGDDRWDEPDASASAAPPRTPRSGVVLRVLLALAIGSAAFGPPWNLDSSRREINAHETVHWCGLQAIDEGYLPYVGPASVGYGPGAQLATWASMAARGRFSVGGFREFQAACVWAAACLFCLLALLALPAPAAALGIVLALLASPLASWTWTEAGVLEGFFGWANPLRNIGSLVLSLGVLALIRRGSAGAPRRADALVLGLVWGLLAYFAQENLFGGLLIVGLLLGLGVAGARLSLAGCLRAGAWLAVGLACVAAPVLLVYAWEGELGAFLHNYFLVPGRFVRGYGNTDYNTLLSEDPLAVAFHSSAPLATLLGASALYRARPLRPVERLGDRSLLAVGLVLAFLSAFPSALLRSDPGHYESTTFALPMLIAAAVLLPPSVAAGAPRLRHGAAAGTALAAVLLAYLPTWVAAPGRLAELARGRRQSFELAQRPAEPAGPAASETARRYGPTLARTPRGRDFIELLARLRERVGDDPVFVYVDVPRKLREGSEYLFDGFVYFMADLVPGPIWIERTDMVADSGDLAEFHARFAQRVADFDWVVSIVPTGPEVEIFRAAHPGAAMEVLAAGPQRLFLFGKAGATPASAAADREVELRAYDARIAALQEELERARRGLAATARKSDSDELRRRLGMRLAGLGEQLAELDGLRREVATQLAAGAEASSGARG